MYIHICNPNCRVFRLCIFYDCWSKSFRRQQRKLHKVLKVLEETIGDKKYFGGEEIGLSDINLGLTVLSFGVIWRYCWCKGVGSLVYLNSELQWEHPSMWTNLPSHHELFSSYKQKRKTLFHPMQHECKHELICICTIYYFSKLPCTLDDWIRQIMFLFREPTSYFNPQASFNV